MNSRLQNVLRISTLSSFLWLISVSVAQRGIAPNGYYPRDYNGDIFSGTVTHIGNDTVTLTFAKGTKEETFEGHLQNGCAVPRADGRNQLMTASQIPLNSKITAFYVVHKLKMNDEKRNENEIIAISFDEYQGRRIPDSAKKAYSCVGSAFTLFRAFH